MVALPREMYLGRLIRAAAGAGSNRSDESWFLISRWLVLASSIVVTVNINS